VGRDRLERSEQAVQGALLSRSPWEAFDSVGLLLDVNMRAGAEATVTKADVALCKRIAASRPDGCGNNVPITIVRRPDGQLRVQTGHRRAASQLACIC
jgi:hypothetical protein